MKNQTSKSTRRKVNENYAYPSLPDMSARSIYPEKKKMPHGY